MSEADISRGRGPDDGDERENEIGALLRYLREAHGFRYEKVARRRLVGAIADRMELFALQEYSDYGDYLLVRPDELPRLLDTVFDADGNLPAERERWTIIADRILRPLT